LTAALESDLSMRRVDANVIGRVQGVGYRYFVLREATALGLSGWVANTAEGSVRCVAEGPETDLGALIDRLREGPAAAIVERVSIAWMPATGSLGTFSVRSGAHTGD
jgi:acylphosphatase